MATITKGTTFASGDVATPAKLNNLVDAATVSNIVNADISASAAITDTKLATISSAGKVANSSTTATSANTASAIVARDASGNFSAGTITATQFIGPMSGTITGNASTASSWQTARNLSLTGDVAATLSSVNGSANVSAVATISNASVTTAKIADGAVTSAKLGNDIILVPAGAVMPFAMNSAPSGWLAANGSAVSRTTYAGLFTAIGTTYGAGDGSTTFNLPDLRGYFVRGAGTNSDATVSGTFGAKQADAVIAHTHSGTTGNDSPDHSHGFTGGSGTTGASSAQVNPNSFTATYYTNGASTRHQHAFTTSSQSPAGATETRPKNIALLYCIKF